MDGNLHVNLGDAAIMEATHPLRDTTRFYRAIVRDSANSPVAGSPFAMTHNGNGVYRSTGFTPAAVGKFSVEIEAYTDAGFTTYDPVVCPFVTQMKVDEDSARLLSLDNVKITTARANNLDLLDAAITTRQSETDAAARAATNTSQHTATQNAITALNDLSIADIQTALTNQGYTAGRAGNLDNLDVVVSSRAVEANAVTRQTALLAQHTATQNAIAALNNLSIADVQTGLDNNGYTSARAALLDNIDVAVSTRVSETDQAARQVLLIAEHDATQAAIAALNNPTPASIADAVWDEARAGHVAAGSFGEALQGVLSPVRAGNLDNLDATVSSRAIEANAVTRQTAVLAQHTATQNAIAALNDLSIADVQTALTNQGYTGPRAVLLDNLDAAISTRATQSSVDNIQNNTRFVGVVPAITQKPDTGSINYKVYARLFDTAGNPEDPDTNTMNVRIEEAGGTIVVATTAMTRISQGVYEYTWAVPSTLNNVQHAVIFEYNEQSVAFSQVRTTLVSEAASSIENIETIVSGIDTKLGTPVLADFSADIQSRQAETAALTRFNTLNTGQNDIDSAIAALNDLSQADVQAALTAQGYTNVRAALLDNLDAAISTRQSETDAASRAATNQSEHDATQAAIAALNNLDQSDIQAALTAQGYTAARALLIDNLDAAISTRQSETDALNRFNQVAKEATASAIQTQTDQLNFNGANVLSEVAVNSDKTGYTLSAAGISAVADQVWDETIAAHTAPGSTGERLFAAGSGSISPSVIQQIVDDVWDEPTADHSAAGTMGEAQNNAAIYSPQNVANAVWDTQRSTRNSAGTFGEALQGELSPARALLLDNLSRLDVLVSTRSNVTQSNDILNQVNIIEGRLTAARATNLDNLNASISSRATQVSVDALPLIADIINGIWDESQASHVAPGTMGESLQNAGATANPTLVAAAVWDALKTAHTTPGTFGALLDVAISSRATDADIQLIKGAGFSTATDSLEQIRDNLGAGGGGGGDATEAKQDAILNAVALKANQTSVNNLTTLVGLIPTNPLLTTDARLNNLDVAISTRLSTVDFNVIKGGGFNPATDTLEQIAAGTGGAVNLTPVLNELADIKGAGFDTGTDSLAAIEPKIQAAKASADQAASDAVDAKNAANAAASQTSVNSLITAVGNIPTNPVLDSDIRIARLDATVSSRADAALLSQIAGATFNPATDSNEAIRNAISAINAGNATAANQTAIINALATKATQVSVNNLATAVGGIPTNPVLDTDIRINRLDATISSRASDSDMQQVKGGGFTTGSHSLVEIANAISAASLDLTPVLNELQIIKGAGFSPTQDNLDAINDCNKTERAGIRSDTQALLADGEGF